jgi:hypothetical protein
MKVREVNMLKFAERAIALDLLQKSMNDPSPALPLLRGGGKVSSFSLDKGGLRGVFRLLQQVSYKSLGLISIYTG